MLFMNETLTYSVSKFMHKVYGWMAAGLALTAVTSYYLCTHPELFIRLYGSPITVYGILFAQLGLVIYLSARIRTMSYFAASMAFSLYSLLVGISIAPLVLMYTLSSVGIAFATAAGMFGITALYGYYTNTDLSRMGNILLMGLIGLVIASLVNWFVQSSAFEFILSVFGVILFTALTAYDVQKIQHLGAQMAYMDDEGDITLVDRIALLGALMLYLDFINLFLHLLRLMGQRRK